ncbi:MAG: glutamine synthetase type III, partial [Phycisphaerae bacterium]|nr:glutamine synthetase type III [Phycisphaerae bacterium]
NLKSTIDVLPVAVRKDTVELFSKYKVFTEKELQSRLNVLSEAYLKAISIEARTALLMANQHILPASLKYQKDVAEAVLSAKNAGVDNSSQLELLKTLTAAIADFQRATAALSKAIEHHVEGTPYDHAKAARENILPQLQAIRAAGDRLETLVSDEYWPLPTYREMLFIK